MHKYYFGGGFFPPSVLSSVGSKRNVGPTGKSPQPHFLLGRGGLTIPLLSGNYTPGSLGKGWKHTSHVFLKRSPSHVFTMGDCLPNFFRFVTPLIF